MLLFIGNYKSTEFQYSTRFTVYYFNDCIGCKFLDYKKAQKIIKKRIQLDYEMRVGFSN